jgi:transcriptional regulator with XRE-family HTH domain
MIAIAVRQRDRKRHFLYPRCANLAPLLFLRAPMSEIHATDAALGARIRARRRTMGLTQAGLAETLGLSFQQVQKYERGANRVSASMLHRIAQSLGVSVAWLFEAEDEDAGLDAGEAQVRDFLAGDEGRDLAETFILLTAGQRRRILALVRGLVEDTEGGAALPDGDS